MALLSVFDEDVPEYVNRLPAKYRPTARDITDVNRLVYLLLTAKGMLTPDDLDTMMANIELFGTVSKGGPVVAHKPALELMTHRYFGRLFRIDDHGQCMLTAEAYNWFTGPARKRDSDDADAASARAKTAAPAGDAPGETDPFGPARIDYGAADGCVVTMQDVVNRVDEMLYALNDSARLYTQVMIEPQAAGIVNNEPQPAAEQYVEPAFNAMNEAGRKARTAITAVKRRLGTCDARLRRLLVKGEMFAFDEVYKRYMVEEETAMREAGVQQVYGNAFLVYWGPPQPPPFPYSKLNRLVEKGVVRKLANPLSAHECFAHWYCLA